MSSTTLSVTSTATSTAPSTTSSATSCPQVTWEIPTTDAACAIHPSSLHNATDVLKHCCGPAPVVNYNDNCASYCLAQGQNISALMSCFSSNGADPFCNGGLNATATAAVSSTAGATSTGTSTKTGTGTATGSSATSTTSHGAAVHDAKVSAGGVSVIALLFCSALFGALA